MPRPWASNCCEMKFVELRTRKEVSHSPFAAGFNRRRCQHHSSWASMYGSNPCIPFIALQLTLAQWFAAVRTSDCGHCYRQFRGDMLKAKAFAAEFQLGSNKMVCGHEHVRYYTASYTRSACWKINSGTTSARMPWKKLHMLSNVVGLSKLV